MNPSGYETEFGVITLTTNEILSIPREHRNFLIAASLIFNDIRFYCSIMARSPMDALDQDMKVMQIIRRLWCLRRLASVIVEAEKALNAHCGKIPHVKKINRETAPIISNECRNSEFFKVARELRNKSTYHYDLSELDQTLAGFDGQAGHRIFLHKELGKSISGLAEQIFTLPKIMKDEQEPRFEEFSDWCIRCSGSILRFCNLATAQVILANFPKKSHPKITLEISLEAEPKEQRWPLFLVT